MSRITRVEILRETVLGLRVNIRLHRNQRLSRNGCELVI